MTLIAAVQMVLPDDLKPDDSSLQRVVDDIEVASKQQEWVWGNDQYCLRCGKYGHTMKKYHNKRCFAKVKSSHCAASQVKKRRQAAGTHRTECCISYAMHGPEAVNPVVAVADVVDAIAGLDLAGK
jgi:transcription elongation factor Elf1